MNPSQSTPRPVAARSGPPRLRHERGRRWRRRLIKTGAWLLLVFLLACLMAGVFAAVMYHQRTQVANQLLSLPDTPFEIHVEAFEGARSGNFSAGGMRVTLPGADRPLLHVPQAEWRLRWREALAGGVDELVLQQPVLTLDEAHWQALNDWWQTRQAAAGPSPPPTERGLNLAPEARHLRIEDGRIDINVPGWPRVRARIDYTGEAIGILAGQRERLRTGLQRITLRDLEIDLPRPPAPDGAVDPSLAEGHLRLAEISAGFTLEGGHLRVVDLTLTEPVIDLTPQALAELASRLPARRSPASDPEPNPDDPSVTPPAAAALQVPEPLTAPSAPVWVSRVSWDRLGLDRGRLNLRGGMAVAPSGDAGAVNVQVPGLEAKLTMETRQGGWSTDGGWHLGGFDVVVDDLDLAPPVDGPGGRIAIHRTTLSARQSAPGESIDIRRATLDSPVVNLTPALQTALDGWRALLPPTDPEAADNQPGAGAPGFALQKLLLVDGRLVMSGFGPEVAEIELGIHAELADWGNASESGAGSPMGRRLAGWHSGGLQRLALNSVVARYPGREPFFAADTIRLDLAPEQLMAERTFELVALSAPLWRVTSDNVPWFAPTGTGAESPGQRSMRVEPGTDRPLWHGWWARELEVRDGELQVGPLPLRMPEVSGSLVVQTTTDTSDGQPAYFVELGDLRAMLPAVSEQPVARISQVTLLTRPDELWQNGSLGEIELVGARLTAGRGLRDHFAEDNGDPPAEPPPASAGADPDPAGEPNPWLPDWHFERLILRESMLTIADIAPGLPDLPIALDLSTDMVPLVAARMREGGELIKLELSTALRSPQDIRYVVADLPSVFVEFTLAGLLRQEIDRVQVIAPTLNIGQHLFAYIDEYRDLTRGEAEANGAPDMPLPAADEPAGWNILRIEVESGQLVVAPKGVALFPNPFPFSAETELADGRLDASFEVPRGDYHFDQLDLHLDGLSGEVLFHLPVAGDDNNLVEVLRADHIRWRDFSATNAYLSISYDRFGIYVGLGGDAYDGYVNGEFNIYLEHLYNWDGWLSFTGINMRGLTEVISPEYFLMDGTVNLNMVAQGNLEELFEAYGDLTGTTPGLIHISQLDGVLENLPPAWSPLKREIAKLGIEPLRWFEYREGAGDFELGRLGGNISLKLSGEQGIRAFDVELHGQPLSMFIEPVLPERLRQAARTAVLETE